MIEFTFDLNLSSMKFDKFFGQGEPDAGAIMNP